MTTNATKHTPGPWDVGGYKHDFVPANQGGEEKVQVFAGSGPGNRQRIATLCRRDQWGEHDLAQVRANAALIASAPDLLTERDRLRAENAELREAANAVAALLGNTPRDRLGRLDIVTNDTRNAVQNLAIKYDVAPSRDYVDQCAKVLRAALAKVKG